MLMPRCSSTGNSYMHCSIDSFRPMQILFVIVRKTSPSPLWHRCRSKSCRLVVKITLLRLRTFSLAWWWLQLRSSWLLWAQVRFRSFRSAEQGCGTSFGFCAYLHINIFNRHRAPQMRLMEIEIYLVHKANRIYHNVTCFLVVFLRMRFNMKSYSWCFLFLMTHPVCQPFLRLSLQMPVKITLGSSACFMSISINLCLPFYWLRRLLSTHIFNLSTVCTLVQFAQVLLVTCAVCTSYLCVTCAVSLVQCAQTVLK